MVKHRNENVLGFTISSWINFIKDWIIEHVIIILAKKIQNNCNKNSNEKIYLQKNVIKY
jgi:hypothetical protein